MSKVPYTLSQLSGQHSRRLLELSREYGSYFVRVAPGILAVLHPDSMAAIRGHRKGGGRDENPRDPVRHGAGWSRRSWARARGEQRPAGADSGARVHEPGHGGAAGGHVLRVRR